MRGDLFLFLGILFFIFIVWVAEGGPSHPISFAGPYITPLSGVGARGTGYSLSNGGSQTQTNQQAAQNLSKAQSDITRLEESLTEAARFGTPSPYKGLVTMSHSVGSLSNDDPDEEYLSFRTSTRVPTTGLAITGWRIEGEAEGYSLRIPEGVNLPNSGNINPTAPIVMEGGQTAVVTIGDSPIGISFRENMCTGYFTQFQNFNQTIGRECPSPNTDFSRFYVGDPQSYDACKAYVDTVRSCTVPLDTPNNLSGDCFHFIDQYLNYNGCVVAHEGDRGFFGETWRIFLGEDDQFFTHDHDTIKLLDQNGLTVDLLSY